MALKHRASLSRLRSVFAKRNGTVLDLPASQAAVDGGAIAAADPKDFIPLPAGSLLLTLPGRSPVGFSGGELTPLEHFEGEPINAVAAALPLGYTRVALPAYVERAGAPSLPLYGYSALAWAEDGFRVAAVQTDELVSWSPQSHSEEAVREAIALRSVEFPRNAMVAQLSRCATEYGCFTAQNVFLRQGEAALPVSPACNARCLGCISEQDPNSTVRSAQERVKNRPTEEEICDVAIAHLRSVPDAIVSFGQGCEGEPLLAVDLIARAIRRIRNATGAGAIHCNTNASRPAALEKLIAAGLDSIRVSLNSARPDAYAAYYRPRGYGFADVVGSLRLAATAGVAVSLNLLTHPGVTDDPLEVEALDALLRDVSVEMLQTRTLNVDPALYFAAVGRPQSRPLGMRNWLNGLRQKFPQLRIGNFTRGFG